MRTLGPLGGQPEHPRPQRGEQPGGRLGGVLDHIPSLIHRVEVPTHPVVRLLVAMPPGLDRRLVADPHAQDEPAGEGVAQEPCPVGHGHGVPGPDARDPGGHRHPLGGRQEHRGVRHGVLAPHALGEPQRGEPQLLDATSGLALLIGPKTVERERPQADLPQDGPQAGPTIEPLGHEAHLDRT